MNDLDVRSGGVSTPASLPAPSNPDGAQAQALTKERNAPATVRQAISTSSINIPTGSLLQIRLTDPISTKTAKPGDHFHGTLAAAVSIGSMVAIPAGSSVLGRVVSAKAAGHFVSAAELSLELMSVRLPEPNGRGEDAGIISEYLSIEGKGGAPKRPPRPAEGQRQGHLLAGEPGQRSGRPLAAASDSKAMQHLSAAPTISDSGRGVAIVGECIGYLASGRKRIVLE